MTKEKNLAIKKETLPVESMDFTACATQDVLKNIAFLQEEIESETWHIEELARQMELLKSRAIRENLKSDGQYVLVEVAGKKMRNPIRDVAEFEKKFPDGYKRIRIAQLVELQETMRNLESTPIPLGLADKWVGEALVTEYTGFMPQKIRVEVRKKIPRLT